MQNTMVRGGDGQLGKKNKIRSKGEKIKKRKKRRKITLKKGEKVLKCIFLGYNLKKISRRVFRPGEL